MKTTQNYSNEKKIKCCGCNLIWLFPNSRDKIDKSIKFPTMVGTVCHKCKYSHWYLTQTEYKQWIALCLEEVLLREKRNKGR